MDFDTYAWRARRTPLLIAIAPALPLLGGLLPTSTFGRGVAIALAVLLIVGTQLVRDAGRAIEADMWERWGGPPTRRALRFAGAASAVSISQLHDRVAEVTGDQLPTEAEERAGPAAADARYDAAVGTLRELTRKREDFPLVLEENANYGMRRNLLGLKAWGIAVCVACAATAAAFLAFGGDALQRGRAGWIVALALSALMLLLWLVVVNEGWVRKAADLYAERLMGSVEALRRRGST